jgi:hypothetical protein
VSPQNGPPHSVRQVIADVDLETGADKRAKVESFRQSDWAQKPAELSRIEQNILDPTKYLMRVTLTAELADGRRVTVPGFEFSGPRDGVGAIWFRYHGPQLHDDRHEHERLLNETYHVRLSDIEDAIDQMLEAATPSSTARLGSHGEGCWKRSPQPACEPASRN